MNQQCEISMPITKQGPKIKHLNSVGPSQLLNMHDITSVQNMLMIGPLVQR
jgi:hypothetical protein